MFFATLVIYVVAIGPIWPTASEHNPTPIWPTAGRYNPELIWPTASRHNPTDSYNSIDRRLEADHFYGRGVSGRDCLSPCAAGGGHCLVEYLYPLQSELCWFLQFYTMQYEGKPLCMGPCKMDFRGHGYKCAVSATSWDDCNPNSLHEMVFEARTLLGGEICKGDCTADERGVPICRIESGAYAACDSRAGQFIRAHTYDGTRCKDRCKRRDGNKWPQCTAEKMNPGLYPCAPPARYYMRAESIPVV